MNQKPIVAIMYDFDKTLSPKDMQEYGFIDGLGMNS
ncbi:MAG: haloacid dehalogenase-like hydrolase, partial [Sedimentibacter sp.]